MERMNRRAIIKGASATIAAIAMPAIATAASATPETELNRLIRVWQAIEAELTIEGRAVDALERSLLKTAPVMPDALTAPIAIAGDKPLTPSNAKIGWTVESLDSYLASATYFSGQRIERPDGGFTLECADLPLPPATLKEMRYVRSLRESHDAAIEAHFAEHAARQLAWEADLDRADAALQDIFHHNPDSLAELKAKATFIKASPVFDRFCSGEVLEQIGKALIADIERLAT